MKMKEVDSNSSISKFSNQEIKRPIANGQWQIRRGFTLVELLIVMAILSVLVGLVGSGFRNSQLRGRDAQRKSDLRQVASSLELIFSDYGKYPDDDGAGGIKACPYDPSGASSSTCSWGQGEMTDGKTLYLKQMPQDPTSGLNYFYRAPSGSGNQKFQLFARLENVKDQNCLGDSCEAPPPPNYTCGSQLCNFAITSSNTDYSE